MTRLFSKLGPTLTRKTKLPSTFSRSIKFDHFSPEDTLIVKRILEGVQEKNYRKVFGVDEKAGAKEITKARNELLKKFHPDKKDQSQNDDLNEITKFLTAAADSLKGKKLEVSSNYYDPMEAIFRDFMARNQPAGENEEDFDFDAWAKEQEKLSNAQYEQEILRIKMLRQDKFEALLKDIQANKPALTKLEEQIEEHDDFVQIINALEKNSYIKKLVLPHSYQTDDKVIAAICEMLNSNKTLEKFSMDLRRDVEVTKKIFDSLKQNQTLKEITIDHIGTVDHATDKNNYNDVLVNGAAGILSAKPQLEKLELSCLQFTKQEADLEKVQNFAEVLQSHKNLKELSISRCNLGAAGIKAIADSLKYNSSVTKIAFNYYFGQSGEFGDEEIKAIADLLRDNKNIQSVEINSAFGVSKKGVDYLLEALKTNKTITKFDVSFRGALGEVRDKAQQNIKEILKNNQEKNLSAGSSPSPLSAEVQSKSKDDGKGR